MKKLRQILITSLTVLLFFSSFVYGDIWKPAKRLSYTTGSSDFPAIAVSGSSIFVVWQNTTGNEGIYFKRSIDRGINWKPTRKLSTSESGYHPDIASEGSSVYVVWVDYNMETYNYEIYFNRSVDKGVNWKPTKRIAYGTDRIRDVAIAVNGSQIYVAWVDLGYYGNEIYFKRSVDGGITWKATKKLATNAQDFSEPAIGVDGPNLYVVWRSISNQIYFKRSVDGGVTWKTEISLTESLSMNPGMAIDGSNIYVVWSQCFGAPKEPEIYFKRSVNRGVNWTSDKGLTKNSGVSWHPAIAVDGSKVYVVWMDNTPGNEGLHFKRSEDGGATWTAYKRIREMVGVLSIFPDIAVNGSNIYVVWPDGNEVFFKIGVVE